MSKNADISNIKGVLVLKGIISKTTYVRVYVSTKFQVSSIILTSVIKGRRNFIPKNRTPKKASEIRVKTIWSYRTLINIKLR